MLAVVDPIVALADELAGELSVGVDGDVVPAEADDAGAGTADIDDASADRRTTSTPTSTTLSSTRPPISSAAGCGRFVMSMKVSAQRRARSPLTTRRPSFGLEATLAGSAVWVDLVDSVNVAAGVGSAAAGSATGSVREV